MNQGNSDIKLQQASKTWLQEKENGAETPAKIVTGFGHNPPSKSMCVSPEFNLSVTKKPQTINPNLQNTEQLG